MSPLEIYETLSSLFSKDGASINGLKLYSQQPLNIDINYKNNSIEIIFPKNKPKASIKRLITINVKIDKIVLNQSGGWIKLEYFPEFAFSYDKIFTQEITIDTTDIESMIQSKYGKESQEIAKLCLQYAEGWATIASQSMETGQQLTAIEKIKLKRDCFKYVTAQVSNDLENKYGSVILTYLLVFIVIPTIARFIITRLLEKYF